MHGHMNVKSPNNTSKWQMEFNSAFKGLMSLLNSVYANVGCMLEHCKVKGWEAGGA